MMMMTISSIICRKPRKLQLHISLGNTGNAELLINDDDMVDIVRSIEPHLPFTAELSSTFKSISSLFVVVCNTLPCYHSRCFRFLSTTVFNVANSFSISSFLFNIYPFYIIIVVPAFISLCV